VIKIGINGFGRIGRVIARINAIQKRFKLVHINDIIPSIDNLAYLLKYDSTYGRFPGTVIVDGNRIIINDEEVFVSQEKDLLEIPWGKNEIDILIDSTGIEKNILDAKQLIKDGIIKKSIYTMSSNNVEFEVIMGINDNNINLEHNVISSSICDANAIAHVLEFVENEYSILSGSITTLHPWLTYQNLLDGAAKGIKPDPNKFTPEYISENFALGRSSVSALIPKETTAVTSTEKVLKVLKGKLISHSYRVPTSVVSCSDMVLKTKVTPNLDELVNTIKEWAKLNRYICLNYESLTSCDFEGNEASAVIDMRWLQVKNSLMKFVIWYDNEWGYGSRVLDLVDKVARQ